MKHISAFQKAELILIPLTFLFSQILILLFGLEIIGAETWTLMGIPMLIGGLIATSLIVVINKSLEITEFKHLEQLIRGITIIGGMVFILILGIQIVLQITGILVFSLLSLIISIIGDIMTIECILFLWKNVIVQDRLELS